MTRLKIMTFNLRVDTPNDGINCFSGRRERVKEVIMREKPDIIGFQEATDAMTEWLAGKIKSTYEIIGTGRNADYTGEGAKIAYSKKKLELFRLETRWMSETPFTPASRFSYDQSGCPRVFTTAEFIDKKSRRLFRTVNTHLDHVGEGARLCGITQMLQKIDEDNKRLYIPTVITGDFNAEPDSPTVKTVCAHFRDITGNIKTTFHDYGKNTKAGIDCKIDYIFTDAKCTQEAYIIPDDAPGGIYISDHYAVCAAVSI